MCGRAAAEATPVAHDNEAFEGKRQLFCDVISSSIETNEYGRIAGERLDGGDGVEVCARAHKELLNKHSFSAAHNTASIKSAW